MNVISLSFRRNTVGMEGFNINFFEEDALGINPYDNDHLVTTVQHCNWDIRIRCILIDPGSSADVQFWDVFQKLQLNLDDIHSFTGSIIGISGEYVQIMGM